MRRPEELEPERAGERAAEGELPNTRFGGEPSAYTCPECQGNLWAMHDGTASRFRCQIGHTFTEDSLVLQKAETLEAALWTALDALEEQASLARQMAERAGDLGNLRRKATLEERVADLDDRARLVREALLNGLPKTLPVELGGGDAAEAAALRAAHRLRPRPSDS